MTDQDKKRIMIAGAVFVLTLAALVTFTYSKFKSYNVYKDKIAAKQREKKSAEAQIARIPGLRSRMRKLSAQVDKYVEMLPREHEVRHDAFVETVARFAQDLKVDIRRADPVKSASGEGKQDSSAFDEHSYRFELVATFPSFLRFLNKVENWHRFLSVEGIEISPLGGLDTGAGASGDHLQKAKSPQKSIELVITTYTYSPEKKKA